MMNAVNRLMEPSLPAMIVARRLDGQQPPMGLGEPFVLLGGDRLGERGISFAIGREWQPELHEAIASACRDAVEASRYWFRMPASILVGEAGTGRTHMARVLARAAGAPHVILNLSDPVVAHSLRAPRVFGEALPFSPVTAMMAARQIANPIVSVVGVGVHRDADEALVEMIDPATARAWWEDTLELEVDYGEVSWLLQADNIDDVPKRLREQMQEIHLRPLKDCEDLTLLSVAIEVLDDLGLPPADPMLRLAECFSDETRIRDRHTRDIYARLQSYFVARQHQKMMQSGGNREG